MEVRGSKEWSLIRKGRTDARSSLVLAFRVIIVITIRHLSSVIVSLLRISLKHHRLRKKHGGKVRDGRERSCLLFFAKEQNERERILDASHVTHRVKDEELAYYLSWHIVIL